MTEHPENFLAPDQDFMNKVPPEPRTFDELADAPDPLWLAAQNKKSTRQSLWFLGGVVLASLVVGLGLLGIFRALGGPLCEAGQATWICSDTQRWIWMPAAMAVPTFGMVGSGIITMRKLNGYVRWWSWMGVFWFFALYFMLWGIDVLQVFLNWQATLE